MRRDGGIQKRQNGEWKSRKRGGGGGGGGGKRNSETETGVKERLLIMLTTRPKLTAPLHSIARAHTHTHTRRGTGSQKDRANMNTQAHTEVHTGMRTY